MNRELIPINLSQEIVLSDVERAEFSHKRRKLISELRCITGLPEVVSSLNQDTIYKLVLAPDGAKLFKDAQGNLKGVFYKDGKIVEHAKFQEIGPSMFKAAKAIGTQIVLISIVMQLNDIEEKVEKIFRELHGDRLAEIESGISLFRQACAMQSSDKREQLILHAISDLTRGFEKTVSALARQINELPDQKLSFFDNWLGDKSRQAEERHKIAAESFSACLNGLQTLARCHFFLDEQDAALKLVDEGLAKIEKAGIDVAYNRSRLVSKSGDLFPEKIWKQFIAYREQFDKESFSNLIRPEEDVIEIEIKPSELMGKVHA